MTKRLPIVLIVTLALAGQAAAQSKRSQAPAKAPEIPQLVMQGKIPEAVRAVRSSQAGAAAVGQLLAEADLEVTARNLDRAQSILESTRQFLDALEKAKKANFPSEGLQGRSLRLQGIRLSDAQEYAQAETTLRKALEVSIKAQDPVLEAGIHNNLGYAMQHQQKSVEAAAEYDTARQMAEAQKDDLRAGSYNFNHGLMLLQLRRNDAALESFRRAETQNRNAGQASLEARAILMQGVAMSRINSVSPEALKFFSQARSLFEKQGDDRNCGWALYLMGDHVAYSYKFDEAIRYGEMAVPFLKKAQDNAALVNCYNLLSDMYGRMKNAARSEEYKKLAEELASKK